MIENVDCFANHYIVFERENGIPKMRVTDLGNNQFHDIEFPEPVYMASPGQNAEFSYNSLSPKLPVFPNPEFGL